MAAMLRGVVDVDGDVGLLVQFQRLFPDPVARTTVTSERTVARQRS